MNRYVNQRTLATVKNLASASLIGLMSVGVAYSQTDVIKNSSGYQLSNEEKKESVEDIKLSNSRDSNSDVDVVLTSDTQELPGFKNTEVVINQLGFRVPKQFYDEKE